MAKTPAQVAPTPFGVKPQPFRNLRGATKNNGPKIDPDAKLDNEERDSFAQKRAGRRLRRMAK